ncbi:MAG: sigma-70 family RNA polymerase sigma factor [Lewinellaceae bacterium]|nr:sigma-70 family RNA polymerase sigma factor [Lewinellaceae bacterium]
MISMKQNCSDKQILQLLRDGDPGAEDAAFRCIYREVFPHVRRFILKNGGQEEDTRDVFQDVLIGFIRNWRTGKYEPTGPLRNYLTIMARNQWYKRNRKLRTEEPGTNIADNPGISETEKREEEEEALARHRLLQECFKKLPPRCREIIRQFYYFDKSLGEIADMMGYADRKSVGQTLLRCRKKWRDCIEKSKQNNGRATG